MDKLAQFKSWSQELTHLRGISSILAWDQEVIMPPRGAEFRAQQRATLAGISHSRLVDPALSELLDELENEDLQELDRASLREMRRQHEKAIRVPETLVRELEEISSIAYEHWVRARRDSDFSVFEPWLSRIIELKREEARCLALTDSAYETLMDEFEPAAKESQLEAVFSKIRPRLIELLHRIEGSPVRPKNLEGVYPVKEQDAFGRKILTSVGFDWKAGRLDTSPHPFCVGLTPNDVRITTRHTENDFSRALFGMIHEGGHGLYEQGLDEANYGLPVCDSTSLGMHESQSRLWENQIGRSRSFWEHWYPELRKAFPGQLDHLSLDDFVLAINRVSPSLIRVEADEVTYGLHIIMRYEIEKKLISEEINAPDLPDVWDSKMEEYLGIRSSNAADGVLQDTHWSQGLIGYFPTYLLGNLYGAQLLNTASQEIPDLDSHVRSGNMLGLKEWLRVNVHHPGRTLSASDLISKITGEDLSADYFLDYLDEKYSELYRL